MKWHLAWDKFLEHIDNFVHQRSNQANKWASKQESNQPTKQQSNQTSKQANHLN